jgi:hypothetical protein
MHLVQVAVSECCVDRRGKGCQWGARAWGSLLPLIRSLGAFSCLVEVRVRALAWESCCWESGCFDISGHLLPGSPGALICQATCCLRAAGSPGAFLQGVSYVVLLCKYVLMYNGESTTLSHGSTSSAAGGCMVKTTDGICVMQHKFSRCGLCMHSNVGPTNGSYAQGRAVHQAVQLLLGHVMPEASCPAAIVSDRRFLLW